jgi:hypothetical protein
MQGLRTRSEQGNKIQYSVFENSVIPIANLVVEYHEDTDPRTVQARERPFTTIQKLRISRVFDGSVVESAILAALVAGKLSNCQGLP